MESKTRWKDAATDAVELYVELRHGSSYSAGVSYDSMKVIYIHKV